MYKELNIKKIIEEHFKSFHGKNGKLILKDKISYVYLPLLISAFLGIVCHFSDSLKNIVSVCLSILIGLLFNLLILVITNIDTEKFINHNNSDLKKRVLLLNETFYNVSFSVVISLFSLIFLFLIDVFKFSISFNDFLILFFEIDIDKIIQSLLYVLLYFSLINTFIVLFMILKRVEKLFSVKLNQEIEIIEKKEKKELNDWEDIETT